MLLSKEFNSSGVWLFRYRSVLPLILLIPGLILFLVPEMNHESSLAQSRFYVYGCLFVSLIGLSIRIYTVGYTPDRTSGRNTKQHVADSLNTTGIYSVVRNPLYLGNFLLWFGVGLLCHHIWFIIIFCLTFMLFYERIIYSEEQFLQNKFGDIYIKWSEKTPAIIPGFRNFKKNIIKFSWRKVLRKEKNGFAAIFLVFGCFNVLGVLVRGNRDFDLILLVMAGMSAILYFVLKYLKYKTKILTDKNR